jgi:hypothetical protein
MQTIQLCEDDGLFHEGGAPTMVVVLVKFDDGKVKRFPYPADKPIAALYQDIRAIEPKIAELPQFEVCAPLNEGDVLQDLTTGGQGKVIVKAAVPAVIAAPKEDRSKIIEKEDIVTLVKLNERDTKFSGTISPLIIGMEYRVVQRYGMFHPITQKYLAESYDVVDDTSPSGLERMRVFPDEVVLTSKRLSKIIDKISSIEEVLPCPSCQAKNSLVLDGDEFKGTCEACQQDIVIARIIKQCQTSKCGNTVSCFDVGGKYAGMCGKCGSQIEVPYAA